LFKTFNLRHILLTHNSNWNQIVLFHMQTQVNIRERKKQKIKRREEFRLKVSRSQRNVPLYVHFFIIRAVVVVALVFVHSLSKQFLTKEDFVSSFSSLFVQLIPRLCMWTGEPAKSQHWKFLVIILVYFIFCVTWSTTIFDWKFSKVIFPYFLKIFNFFHHHGLLHFLCHSINVRNKIDIV